MKIAVLKEQVEGERRVAAIPETVKKFASLGATLAVEQGAGLAASIADADYEAAGASLGTRADVLKDDDIVLAIQGPSADSIKGIKQGAWLVAGLNPFGDALYLFINRRRDKLKALYWHRNGFCLWYKRLEAERFAWPAALLLLPALPATGRWARALGWSAVVLTAAVGVNVIVPLARFTLPPAGLLTAVTVNVCPSASVSLSTGLAFGPAATASPT